MKQNPKIACYQVWKSMYEGDKLLWEGIGWMEGESYDPVYLMFTFGDRILVATPMAGWRIKRKPKKHQ